MKVENIHPYIINHKGVATSSVFSPIVDSLWYVFGNGQILPVHLPCRTLDLKCGNQVYVRETCPQH